MIKSTRYVKRAEKTHELLINMLKEFELAYNLSWSKTGINYFKEPVFKKLVEIVEKVLHLQLIDPEKEAEKRGEKVELMINDRRLSD
jgi:hypothetical protein